MNVLNGEHIQTINELREMVEEHIRKNYPLKGVVPLIALRRRADDPEDVPGHDQSTGLELGPYSMHQIYFVACQPSFWLTAMLESEWDRAFHPAVKILLAGGDGYHMDTAANGHAYLLRFLTDSAYIRFAIVPMIRFRKEPAK